MDKFNIGDLQCNDEARAITKYFARKFSIPWDTMWIAGSWAANAQRAGDIDIWVNRPGCEIWDEEYRDLGNMIHGASYEEMAAAKVLGTKPDSYLDWYGKSVQIIETPYEIFELMDLFDLSCCCWTITHNGVLVKGALATHPTKEPIKVLRRTPSTDHRLVKLNKRYGHTPERLLEIPF